MHRFWKKLSGRSSVNANLTSRYSRAGSVDLYQARPTQVLYAVKPDAHARPIRQDKKTAHDRPRVKYFAAEEKKVLRARSRKRRARFLKMN
jgi:hypothetical protein